MGDRNQILFGMKFRGSFQPPFLEVGSREYGNTATFRKLLPHGSEEYVGVDISPGTGVDRVVDLACDFDLVHRVLPERFNTIFCLSVLEHCRRPWLMAANLEKLLLPGGCIYVSVPFCWRIHNYPADYWRFTPDGIRALFPGTDFTVEQTVYHSSEEGVFYSAGEPPPRIELTFRRALPHYGAGQAFWIAVARRLGWLRPLRRHDYIYPPLQLDMIGRRSGTP